MASRLSLILAAGTLVAVLAAGPGPSAAADSVRGTGLPLPRFVSLRANEVNMRTGPGLRYPVEWVYHRRRLPMEVIAEYGTWRKVRDWQGTQGWVHQSMLDGRRTVVVLGDIRTLRAHPDSHSDPVARLEPGVVAEVAECPPDTAWCQVNAANHLGWLRRVEIWGVYNSEAF